MWSEWSDGTQRNVWHWLLLELEGHEERSQHRTFGILDRVSVRPCLHTVSKGLDSSREWMLYPSAWVFDVCWGRM